MTLKLNDVYDFRYTEDAVKSLFGDIHHCFDGQLVVRPCGQDELQLVDTYWSTDGRRFSLAEAQKLGTLTFKCNLDEVENIHPSEVKYYADADVFNLSHQHGCHKSIAKRKGAQRDKDKMLETAEYELAEAERKVESAKLRVEIMRQSIAKILSGDLNIYF